MTTKSNAKLREAIEAIIYCTTGCGSNADPADGFGYCTCGAKEERNRLLTLFHSQQRQLLQGLMEQITKSAIVTLDTDPIGIDKVKNIPVGKFVRLNDVRAVMQKFINDSQAVS